MHTQSVCTGGELHIAQVSLRFLNFEYNFKAIPYRILGNRKCMQYKVNMAELVSDCCIYGIL